MRFRSVLSEAWRNLRTGTSPIAALMGAVAATGVLLGFLDASAAAEITERATQFRERGAATWITEAGGAIDGAACDRLSEVDGIAAAGALASSQDSITFLATPRNPVPVIEGTAGFFRLLMEGRYAQPGLLVSENVAERYALAPGDVLSIVGPDSRTVGAFPYPSDGRRPGLEYSAVLPTSAPVHFDQCWTEVWPSAAATGTIGRLAVAPGRLADAETYQLNSTMGEQFNGHDLYRRRPSRHAGVIAVLLGVGIGVLSVVHRRLELSSALHLGMNRSSLTAIIAAETVAWSACAGLLGLAVARMLANGGTLGDDPPVSLLVRPIGWAIVGAVAGALGATARMRQRHLLAAYKNRR